MLKLLKPLLPSPPPSSLPSPPPDLLLPSPAHRSFEICPPSPSLRCSGSPPAFQISPDLSPSFPSLPPSPPPPNLRPSCQICPDLSSRSPPPKISPPHLLPADNLAIYKAFLSGSKLQGLAGMPAGRDWGRRHIHGALPPLAPFTPDARFQKKTASFKTFRSKVIGTQTLYNFYKAFHTDPTAQGLGGARKDLGWRALEGL